MTNTLNKTQTSFFNDFEDDRITDIEMFDTFGGIERNETIEDVTENENTVFDGVVPDKTDDDPEI